MNKKDTIAAFGKVTLADTVFILSSMMNVMAKEYSVDFNSYLVTSIYILALFIAISVNIMVYIKIGDVLKEK